VCDHRAAEHRSLQRPLAVTSKCAAKMADNFTITAAIYQVPLILRMLCATGESISSSADGAEDCDQITSTTSGLLRAFIADHCDFLVNQDGWISRAEELDLPLNPLDELIDELGHCTMAQTQKKEF
jgi:hypothetical protein